MHLWNLDLHEADQFIQIIDNWNKTFSIEDRNVSMVQYDGCGCLMKGWRRFCLTEFFFVDGRLDISIT